MATVSGSLLYDNARTNSATGLPGIANTPIVLENIDTGLRLAVLTVTKGSYTFTNVPDGNYQIVEAFGDPGPISVTGNFGVEAANGPAAIATPPPISFIDNPPAGATNLDCVTRNTIAITVAGSNITGRNILNGPVKYTPIVIDSSVNVDWADNLINAASAGTFGLFPAGTAGMTGADPNPYPGVNPGFIYVLPAANEAKPSDGYYTIQNIANNVSYQVNGSWWRIADRTTGNETGRMMIVNGDNPGSVFFEDSVNVLPNTYYLFVTNILNLIKISGRASPELGVIITAPDGTILYDKDLGEVIPVNFDQPEWLEDGTIIHSGNYTFLDVKFISNGEAASGNDYAIDNVGFYEVDIALQELVKSASQTTAVLGDIIDFTVTFTNDADSDMTGITFTDSLPDGLAFVPESVIINGINCLECDPSSGFDVPDVVVEADMVISFKATVDYMPSSGIASNTAFLKYDIVLVEMSPPTTAVTQSNTVDIILAAASDIYVQKTGPTSVQGGDDVTYNITVGNNGPDKAVDVLLYDTLPAQLSNPQYSTDKGLTWNTWTGMISLGDMETSQISTILIRGTSENPKITTVMTNSANVTASTHDPNPDNNTSTFNTTVIPKGSKKQAITDLIQSVALQEAALAHIINAEGKKMQKIIAMGEVSAKKLMVLNRSVTQLVSTISRLEMLFTSKLELFTRNRKRTGVGREY